ncbi:hypothetical protein TRAPUB_120 [Trametes pubescens]|uniref:Hydrophobin n=1 Tax=Trametes pubescens TaxID=154538 RepID=A0A1M2VN49_TRAPU|nr:hypothetical protein TRAPUB_120 [Trametes pubescens]
MFDKLAVFVTLLITFVAATPMPSPDTLLKCFEGTSQCCASVKHVISATVPVPNILLYYDLMATHPQAGIDCTQFDVFIDLEDADRPSCDSEALLACCDDNTLVKGVDSVTGIPTEGIACKPLVQAVNAGF